MKKLLLLLLTVTTGININAQSDCSSAQTVTDGTYTVSTVDGTAPTTNCIGYPSDFPPNAGVWYEYTNNGSQDLLINVTTDLMANAGGDTKLSILTGLCGNLTCVANNDDVNFIAQGDPNNNLLSETEFVAEIGETYYIVFDATWDSSGFDFEVTSSTNVPNPPAAAVNPDPADGATNVDVEETTDENNDPIQQTPIQWAAPASGPAPTGYEVYFGTDQNNLNLLGEANADAAGSPLNITGMQYDTTYYWEIVPINGPVSATGTQVWSFTTEDNLSNEQFETVNFDFYVNNGQLFLNANQSFDQISIFDLSGKKVMSQELSSNDENVSIQSLASGLYLAKVQIGEQTKTIKFLK